jgi:hypothetical protein
MKGIDLYDPRESFDYLTGFSFVWDWKSAAMDGIAFTI